MDIDAGAAVVDAIGPHVARSRRAGVLGGLGGFGALFDLKACGFRDPVLVAATDGVGTKLAVASAVGDHRGVGIDLVAMCVNDIVVQGAEPLFFLDYYASGRLDVAAATEVIAGIAAGCRTANCALIGGETAEMPGHYAPGTYDLAGFAVGAVERDRVLDGTAARPGDVILGLGSSGLHANGFSLVRRLIADHGLSYDAEAPFAPDRTLGSALLEPTRIYIRSCLALARAGGLRGLAHITGGGLLDNIPRVIPPHCQAALDATAWPLPPVFGWLGRLGALSLDELARTFNCGLGMVAIVSACTAENAMTILRANGETVWPVGRMVSRPEGAPGVTIGGRERAWQS